MSWTTSCDDMKPLRVTYTRIWAGPLGDNEVALSRGTDLIGTKLLDLGRRINEESADHVDHVILIGQYVATGWRIRTSREVHFSVADDVDEREPDALQAEGRIQRFIDPVSVIKTIEPTINSSDDVQLILNTVRLANHEEALQFSHHRMDGSNLARCYAELRKILELPGAWRLVIRDMLDDPHFVAVGRDSIDGPEYVFWNGGGDWVRQTNRPNEGYSEGPCSPRMWREMTSEEKILNGVKRTAMSDLVSMIVDLPSDLSDETRTMLAGFVGSLGSKLSKAQKKYGYTDEWINEGWMGECRRQLLIHMAKGDPIDVAAYCAFLWYHSEKTI